MYLVAKFGGHRSYGNGDTNSYINSYTNTPKKLNSPPRSVMLIDFQNHEYRFTIRKTCTRLVERQQQQQQQQQQRQLQSVIRFTQKQWKGKEKEQSYLSFKIWFFYLNKKIPHDKIARFNTGLLIFVLMLGKVIILDLLNIGKSEFNILLTRLQDDKDIFPYRIYYDILQSWTKHL